MEGNRRDFLHKKAEEELPKKKLKGKKEKEGKYITDEERAKIAKQEGLEDLLALVPKPNIKSSNTALK